MTKQYYFSINNIITVLFTDVFRAALSGGHCCPYLNLRHQSNIKEHYDVITK